MAISHHAVYQNGATVVWLGVMSLKPEDGGSSTYSPMNFSAGQVCEHCWLADGSVQPVGFMGDSPYGCPHGGEQR